MSFLMISLATSNGLIETFFPRASCSLFTWILTFTVSMGWIMVVASNDPQVAKVNFLVMRSTWRIFHPSRDVIVLGNSVGVTK